jgi:polyphosphate kinase 2 (PPK2 family)
MLKVFRNSAKRVTVSGEDGIEARIDDGRKVWKLSPMDIKSYTRWDDYTKASDEMFHATDTAWAPGTSPARMTRSGRG